MLLISDLSSKVGALLIKIGFSEETLTAIQNIDSHFAFKWLSITVIPTLFLVVIWQKKKLYSYQRRYGRR
ncbi:hypothetical protein NF867_02750 [Solitalea sp. MAHUQ-68]|uniref:Uncharacterized protein n=1 Tax=Solitalea agri TaxID=2953739 RepID=A0A9X2EZA0_9SPHI|nr:hypothetical protein [Solitalea agri]MCO4291779.1 hypothetical protein [Solitalea agri]